MTTNAVTGAASDAADEPAHREADPGERGRGQTQDQRCRRPASRHRHPASRRRCR